MASNRVPAFSLAAAQTVPHRGDVKANIEQHLGLVHRAAEEQVDAVVFPELSLTGYELALGEQLAFAEDDARLAPLAEAARLHDVVLVVGAPIRLGPELHIGAFILFPDRPHQIYTKHHLGAFSPDDNPGGAVPPPEASVFQPGDRNPLFAVRGQTAAVAICADTSRPSHPQRAADGGATVYLASSFVIPSDLDGKRERLAGYAARHHLAVVLANYGGPSGGLPSAGSSAIWCPGGELVGQLGHAGAGLVVASLQEESWQAKTIPLGEG